jgi:hypothetical protein
MKAFLENFSTMCDPAQTPLAAAVIFDSRGRLLLVWNDNWGAFALSMTKLHCEQPEETHEQSGVRTVAEVLGLPTRVVPDKAAKFARGLQESPRDGDIKDYQYKLVPIEVHPDFASHIRSQPFVWALINKLQTGEYQPISKSVEALLRECVEWGWI